MLLALRDSIYGTVKRVSVGAALSMLDGGSDIYMINNYVSQGLNLQANTMIAMVVMNMVGQIMLVLVQYKRKSWKVKVKEALICLFFLRPAVDVFRVSTNYQDGEATFDPLNEMLGNKVRWCFILITF